MRNCQSSRLSNLICWSCKEEPIRRMSPILQLRQMTPNHIVFQYYWINLHLLIGENDTTLLNHFKSFLHLILIQQVLFAALGMQFSAKFSTWIESRNFEKTTISIHFKETCTETTMLLAERLRSTCCLYRLVLLKVTKRIIYSSYSARMNRKGAAMDLQAQNASQQEQNYEQRLARDTHLFY